MARKKSAQTQPEEPTPAAAEAPEEPAEGEGEPAELAGDEAPEELDPGLEEDDPEPESPSEGEPSQDELYQEATRLRVKGRAKMTYVQLRTAVEAAREGHLEPDDLEPEEPDVVLPTDQVTQQQAQAILQATQEQLEGVLADPNLPLHLRLFIQKETASRAERAAEVKRSQTLKTPLERFVVTKGGRYVSKDGCPGFLAEGALVMPTTHDLKHVAAQGIEFKPCGEPMVFQDELGRQVSRLT
jgi:hypothetical protein